MENLWFIIKTDFNENMQSADCNVEIIEKLKSIIERGYWISEPINK